MKDGNLATLLLYGSAAFSPLQRGSLIGVRCVRAVCAMKRAEARAPIAHANEILPEFACADFMQASITCCVFNAHIGQSSLSFPVAT
jgi:hypothetical protein